MVNSKSLIALIASGSAVLSTILALLPLEVTIPHVADAIALPKADAAALPNANSAVLPVTDTFTFP